MNKTLTIALMCLLAAGCADPITDSQVKSMTAHCEAIGMKVKVFNGLTSTIECKERDHG